MCFHWHMNTCTHIGQLDSIKEYPNKIISLLCIVLYLCIDRQYKCPTIMHNILITIVLYYMFSYNRCYQGYLVPSNKFIPEYVCFYNYYVPMIWILLENCFSKIRVSQIVICDSYTYIFVPITYIFLYMYILQNIYSFYE